MYRAHVQELHDTLVELAKGKSWRFAMAEWLDTDGEPADLVPDPHQCGAIGCMAGWAAMLAHARDPARYRIDLTDPARVAKIAQVWLGLSQDQAKYWFMGDWHPELVESELELEVVTLEDVIAFLAGILAGTVNPNPAPEQERLRLPA